MKKKTICMILAASLIISASAACTKKEAVQEAAPETVQEAEAEAETEAVQDTTQEVEAEAEEEAEAVQDTVQEAEGSLPALTIAFKAGLPCCSIGYRITQIDEDSAEVMPYVENDTFYVPAAPVNDAYGLNLSGEYVSLSDIEAEGLYTFWQKEDGSLKDYCIISAEFTSDVIEGEYESQLIRVPGVEQLYTYTLDNDGVDYVWAELPVETYNMLYPNSTYYPNASMAGFGMYDGNRELYSGYADKELYKESSDLTDEQKGQVKTVTVNGEDYYYDASYEVNYYVPGEAYSSKYNELNLLFIMDGDDYNTPEIKNLLDNLIASEEIEPVIAIFMPSGGGDGANYPMLNFGAGNSRSLEYDSIDSRYANFIVDQVFPAVGIGSDYDLCEDTTKHTAIGFSSGGNAAVALAWHRTDVFGSVIMVCASITDMRQGNLWQSAFRANDRKDIKFFIMDGYYDHDIVYGSWPLANMQFAQSLEYKGYEFIFTEHMSSHDDNPIRNSLPQILGWVWYDKAFYDDNLNIAYSSDAVVTDADLVTETVNERGVTDSVNIKLSDGAKELALDMGSLDIRYHIAAAENDTDLEQVSLQYLAGRRGYKFTAESSDPEIVTADVSEDELFGGDAGTITLTPNGSGETTVKITRTVTSDQLPNDFAETSIYLTVTVE